MLMVITRRLVMACFDSDLDSTCGKIIMTANSSFQKETLLFSVNTDKRGPYCKELVILVSQELGVYIVGAIKGLRQCF